MKDCCTYQNLRDSVILSTYLIDKEKDLYGIKEFPVKMCSICRAIYGFKD